MNVRFSNQFYKQYNKLRPSVRLRFQTRLKTFKHDRFDSELRNHAVKGKKYQGYRSIDITGDIRALYVERPENVVIFGFIGSHAQLYG